MIKLTSEQEFEYEKNLTGQTGNTFITLQNIYLGETLCWESIVELTSGLKTKMSFTNGTLYL
jgi:hypothetical protein